MSYDKTKVFSVLLLISLVVLGMFLAGCKQQPKEEVIKIGAVLPLTGKAAWLGEGANLGALLAQDEINKEGGINGKRLELIIDDSQSDNKIGVDAANKLINIDKVNALITTLTGVSFSVGPIAVESGVFMLYESTNPTLAEENKIIFRDYTSASNDAKALAEIAFKNGVKNVALLYNLENPASQLFAHSFKDKFEELGGTTVDEETYSLKDTDLKTQLIKIKNSDAEGIVFEGYPPNGILVLKQVRELGIRLPVFNMLVFRMPPVMASEEAVEGLNYTNPYVSYYSYDLNDPNMSSAQRDFVEKFKEKFGKDPDPNAAYMYDDIKALAIALENCDKKGKSRDAYCIKDEMQKIDMEGAAGKLSFDENGNSIRPVFIYQFINGEWKRVK